MSAARESIYPKRPETLTPPSAAGIRGWEWLSGRATHTVKVSLFGVCGFFHGGRSPYSQDPYNVILSRRATRAVSKDLREAIFCCWPKQKESLRVDPSLRQPALRMTLAGGLDASKWPCHSENRHFRVGDREPESSCGKLYLIPSLTFSCGRGRGEGSDAPQEPPHAPSSAQDHRAAATPIKVGFIVGPTGIGKTALALDVAERLGAEIINADSRQVYRGMDIGTAKPGPAELARVPHHLVDVRSPGQPLDVAQFRTLARAAIAEVAARGRPALVTGGSGLYLRVLRYGIFNGPGAAPELRRELLDAAHKHGVEYLYNQLRQIDPPAAARLEPRDLYRIVRAIEVFRLTGVAMSRHQAAHGFSRPEYDTLTIGLRMDRERLYRTIGERFDAMIAAGLTGEVQALLAAGYAPHVPPLSTIGYKHIAAHLKGEITLEAAIDLAKRDTRRLAKRQMTWFRRDPEIVWIDVEGGAEQAYSRFADFFAQPAKP